MLIGRNSTAANDSNGSFGSTEVSRVWFEMSTLTLAGLRIQS
jgi:hypothetical protein